MKTHQSWLRFLIVMMLILGVFLRLVNLDRKIYWPDEAVTSLRISGYTRKELIQEAFKGNEISVTDLAKFKSVNNEKTAIDTIKSLALEEPQLPPLYFVMLRFWVQWFGDSVTAIRSFSACISLLAFPCIYWLCRELFASPGVAWVAIALIAVSPFHLLYAQEARPYSLWTVTILLSSAALLRARRLQTKLSWGIYAIATILGLYTFLLSGLVAIGHGIYIFVTEHFKLTKTVINFLLASLVGFLTLVPWILAVINNFSKAEGGTDWASQKVSLLSLITMWTGNVSRLFFDVGVGSDDPLVKLVPLIPVVLTLLIIVGYSIYFLCCHAPKQSWLFILSLVGVTALGLILPDLVFDGRRSGVARYLIPCYLGIELAVSYSISTQISPLFLNLKKQKMWKFVTIFLFSSGIISCLISSPSQIWWNKGPNLTQSNFQASRIINQTAHPLLISDTDPAYILSFSYLLEPKVRIQEVVRPRVLQISKEYNELFLYKPSEKFRYLLEKEYGWKFAPTQELGSFQNELWQLEKSVKIESFLR